MNADQAIATFGEAAVLRSMFACVPKQDRRDCIFDLFKEGFEPAEIARDLDLKLDTVAAGVIVRYRQADGQTRAALARRVRIRKSIDERFWDFVSPEPTCGCWLWDGPDNGMYGLLRNGYRNTYAHRFSYQKFVGPIPRGLVIDHACRVTFCVNPDHLEPVTQAENLRRARERARLRRLVA
jgi:hypothetical protein